MEESEFAVQAEDAALYALGVGAARGPAWANNELWAVYEGHRQFQPLPTLHTTLPFRGRADRTSSPLDAALRAAGVRYNPAALVHGEHTLTLHAPLRAGAPLRNSTRAVGATEKSSGTFVVVEAVTRDVASGAAVATNRLGLFIKGLRGAPLPRLDAAAAAPPPTPPPRSPDATLEERTDPSQALLYRLSGDLNPLHCDPQFAAAGGLPAPILHGLCTLGFCVRAIVSRLLGGADAAARVRAVSCRFAGVVYPGETLLVAVWRTSPFEVLFETRVADRGGAPAISGGRLALAPEGDLAAAAAAAAFAEPMRARMAAQARL